MNGLAINAALSTKANSALIAARLNLQQIPRQTNGLVRLAVLSTKDADFAPNVASPEAD